MADLIELTVRYHCEPCGDEFTVDYSDVTEVEESVDHEECPADECGECGCDCFGCVCDAEECGECGCGEDEEGEPLTD